MVMFVLLFLLFASGLLQVFLVGCLVVAGLWFSALVV